MTHPMAEFYPPTCLLCRHLSCDAISRNEPAEISCAKDHKLCGGDPLGLLRAATCPDFDQINAAQRDAMIQEAGK